jgi:PAS domain S-box-containing protein
VRLALSQAVRRFGTHRAAGLSTFTLHAGQPPPPFIMSLAAAIMPYSYLRDRRINDRLFRFVADYTYDWESWHDPLGRLIWVNAAVERLTGYSVDECQAMENYPVPIVSEEFRESIELMIRNAVAGHSHNDMEFQITTKQGARRWMAVSWQPIEDDVGNHLGFRTSVRDITDRNSLREQLKNYNDHLEQLVEERTSKIALLERHRRQMEKMAAIGELAAGVAHEINNPLAGIRNACTIIHNSLPPENKHRDLLDLVDKEIERIASIIQQMYQLYRHKPQVASELDLAEVIGDVAMLLEPIARRHGVVLDLSRAQQSTRAVLPEGEVKQVLFNMVRNAIQASTAGQRVAVGVRKVGETVGLVVRDWGCGIAPEIRPHIFEPFFTTKGQLKEGIGLGLSVTQSLVESMGGTMKLASVVGVGTIFAVSLPRIPIIAPDDDKPLPANFGN